MKKNLPAVLFLCVFFLNFSMAHGAISDGSQFNENKQKSIAAVEEMLRDLDQENLLEITQEADRNKLVEWFKGICKSNKILGETLKLWDEIDDRILIFRDIKPQDIPDIVWVRYCDGKFTLSHEMKQTVEIFVQKRSGLTQLLESTAEKAGYVLAAVSIGQDILNAVGSNDERRLKAIYTTAKNATLNYLMKKAGYTLNPFISIGIDVLEWGLNTFIRLSIDQHRRDWETAYERYMDEHYPDEWWIDLINDTFNEYGGLAQAKNEIQTALDRFWQNPDLNFYDMMKKRSTFSSTRGGALAEKYKKTFIAQYYNWRVKPKIAVRLQEEIGYARDEARYAANNAVEDLMNSLNEDKLRNLQRAIDMASDFQDAELLIKPESFRLKPGESKEFSAVFNIGEHSIPLADSDVKWSRGGGTFTAEKSMAGQTIEITASFSGKNGSAKIEVTGEEDEADLSTARNIANDMKTRVEDAQLLIRDGSDLCRSGNAGLTKIRQDLSLDEEKPSDSPLDGYDRFHLALTEKVALLEGLEEKSDEVYISAGLNKKECEEQTMEACEGASVLMSLRNAMARGFQGASDPDRDPGKIKRAVDLFAAKSKEFGNKSLADIKSVEEISGRAEEEYKSMQEFLDDYLKAIQQAKDEQRSSAVSGNLSSGMSGGLKNCESTLNKLESKIEELGKTEARLTSDLKKGRTFLLRHRDSGEAQSLLKRIAGYCEELQRDLESLKECRNKLRAGIEAMTKDTRDREQINYDSRENRDKIGRLYILQRKTAGFLTGIRENTKWAKGLKSPVEQAVKNAAVCAQKAQEFFGDINANQKNAQDSGFSDAGAVRGEPDLQATAGDDDKCLALMKEFDDFYKKNPVVTNQEARKKAFAILNRAKDCPWYEEGLKVMQMEGPPPPGPEESGFSDAGAATGDTTSDQTQSDPLLGDWIDISLKRETPQLVKDDFARNPHCYKVLRIAKKDNDYYVHLIQNIARDNSGCRPHIDFTIGLNCNPYYIEKGETVIKLKQNSENQFTGQCMICLYDPLRKYFGTSCYITLLNNEVIEFYADIPPDWPLSRHPEHPSRTMSIYYLKVGRFQQ